MVSAVREFKDEKKMLSRQILGSYTHNKKAASCVQEPNEQSFDRR
jgi:hypothetical protein